MVEKFSRYEESDEKKGRGDQLAPAEADCGTICNDWTSWGDSKYYNINDNDAGTVDKKREKREKQS